MGAEFWLSPSSLASYDFLVSFEQVKSNFGTFMNFEPKYKFKDLTFDFENSFLAQHCFGGGTYCAISDIFIESKSELDEAIRQKCIWKYSKSNDKFKDMWWNYVSNYRTCLKDKLKSTNLTVIDCYDKIAGKLKFSDDTMTEIQTCVNQSFDKPSNKFESNNSILKGDLNPIQYSGVYLVPAFFIDGNLVKEDLKLNLVVSAICDKLTNKPDFCQEFFMSNINWSYPEKKNYKNSIIIICSLVSLGIIIILLMVLYVKRRMNRNIDEEIESQIKNHVTEYMKLRDSQDESKM